MYFLCSLLSLLVYPHRPAVHVSTSFFFFFFYLHTMNHYTILYTNARKTQETKTTYDQIPKANLTTWCKIHVSSSSSIYDRCKENYTRRKLTEHATHKKERGKCQTTKTQSMKLLLFLFLFFPCSLLQEWHSQFLDVSLVAWNLAIISNFQRWSQNFPLLNFSLPLGLPSSATTRWISNIKTKMLFVHCVIACMCLCEY